MKQETLKVNGMTCASCAKAVEREIKKLNGVYEVNINFATEKANVKYNPDETRVSEIKDAVSKAGYKALEIKADEQVDEELALLVSDEVSYEEAERLAKEEAAGETYDYGKRSFTVEDINLYGQEDQLVVDVLLSGSYNGNVYLTGRPVYDDRDNAVVIKDLKYTLKTKNVLFKTAGWLLKSTFKNKIEETLNFYLDYNLEAAKKQLKEQLSSYNVTNGVLLNGDLNELTITDAVLTPRGMKVDVLLTGKLNVLINGLN